MAYTHTRPIVPHSRPSFAVVDGRWLRPGSWGPLSDECKLIEAWGAKNRPCGPYTVDYLPGGPKSEPMWKVFRDEEFIRYADTEDIRRMADLLSRNDIATLEDDFLTPPELIMFNSKESPDGDLDEAFGATPKRPIRRLASPAPVDDLDEAFGGGPPPDRRMVGLSPGYKGKRRPVDDLDGAFGATPAGIILGEQDDGDPFDPYGDDLDDAFS